MEFPQPSQSSRARRRGFTLVELLVVAAIVAVLASLAFASIARGRTAAERANCQNNLRQLSQLLTGFTIDNGEYPLGHAGSEDRQAHPAHKSAWFSSIAPEETRVWSSNNRQGIVGANSILRCPVVKTGPFDPYPGGDSRRNGTYGYNNAGFVAPDSNGHVRASFHGLGRRDANDPAQPVRVSDVANPSHMLALGDNVVGAGKVYEDGLWVFQRVLGATDYFGSTDRVRKLHRGVLNAAWCDGHVSAQKLDWLFDSQAPDALAAWNREGTTNPSSTSTSAPPNASSPGLLARH